MSILSKSSKKEIFIYLDLITMSMARKNNFKRNYKKILEIILKENIKMLLKAKCMHIIMTTTLKVF